MGVKGTNCGGINLKHPMILMPTYSARLRAGEVVTVRADVERGMSRIRCGKMRGGCYAISSEAAPGQRKDKHISTRTDQEIFERARNSFASLLDLQNKVQIKLITEEEIDFINHLWVCEKDV